MTLNAKFTAVVAQHQRDASQLHHVTVDGLAEWIAWWEAQEASA